MIIDFHTQMQNSQRIGIYNFSIKTKFHETTKGKVIFTKKPDTRTKRQRNKSIIDERKLHN